MACISQGKYDFVKPGDGTWANEVYMKIPKNVFDLLIMLAL